MESVIELKPLNCKVNVLQLVRTENCFLNKFACGSLSSKLTLRRLLTSFIQLNFEFNLNYYLILIKKLHHTHTHIPRREF